MARRSISLDEKIEKAEAAMLAAKAKYDKALDEMENWLQSVSSRTTKKFWIGSTIFLRTFLWLKDESMSVYTETDVMH